MNRRFFITTAISAVAFTAFTSSLIGARTINAAEWAGEKLTEIIPTLDKDSNSYLEIMMPIVMDGMAQLEPSKIAFFKAPCEDGKAHAKAKVDLDDQTGLTAKLTEVATAIGLTIPDSLSEKAKELSFKLRKQSGSKLDRRYFDQGGVRRHELLKITMMQVQSKSTDPILNEIANTSLRSIKTHLRAAKETVKKWVIAI